MKNFVKPAIALLLLPCAVWAQDPGFGTEPGFGVGDSQSAAGSSAAVDLGYVAENDLRIFQVEITFDDTVLTPQTTTDPIFGELVNGCFANVDFSATGDNWDEQLSSCGLTSSNTITLTVASGSSPSAPALDTITPFGSITFDIASGIDPGQVFPLEVTVVQAIRSGENMQNLSLLTTNDGSVSTAVPDGQSFYSSNPSVNSTVDLGSAVVGSAATAVDIVVRNLQDDMMNSFDITDATGTNGGATIVGTVPGGTATIPADGGNTTVNVSFECTPTARGEQTGTLAIANNSNNEGPSASYDYSCSGLSPNVAITPPPELTGSTADPSGPTANITVTNPQDNFTSTAEGVTATAASGDAEITVTGGPTNIDPDGSFDFEVACNNAAEGDFSRDFDITWTDPVGTGSATINVQCSITDVAPGYTSDPAANTAGTEIDFTQVAFGSSATQTIAIGNEDSSGTGAQAELQITGAVLSDNTNYSIVPASPSFTLDPGDSNGTESIDVTCTPSGVGDIPAATLTVQSNDGDQVYDLACEGDGQLLSATPSGGLNLGSVPPGTTTNEGTITFTNNGISGDITVDNCSFSGDTDVFTSTPGEADFGFVLQQCYGWGCRHAGLHRLLRRPPAGHPDHEPLGSGRDEPDGAAGCRFRRPPHDGLNESLSFSH